MNMPAQDASPFDLLERLSKAHASARPRTPLKVVFISHQHTFWNYYASVLAAMSARPEFFEASALVVPYIGLFKEHLEHVRHPLEEIRAGGLRIDTPETYDIAEERPDIAFFTTPYVKQRELRYSPHSLLEQGCRAALIPYCTEFMGDEGFIRDYFGYCASGGFWRIFTASPMSSQAYRLYAGAPEWNVPVSGNPEYDAVLGKAPDSLKKYQRIKALAAGRTIILWTPHFRNSEGWATWETMGRELAHMFRKFGDKIFLVFRPHQLLAAFIRKWVPGTPAEHTVGEIARIIHSADNCWLDDDDLAIESVYAADALVSDMSSMLTKAMALGKSVMYTYGKEGSGAGMAAPVLTSRVHNSTDVDGVKKFVNMIINGELDPLLPLPAEVKNDFCGPADGKAGAGITDYIQNYFFPA